VIHLLNVVESDTHPHAVEPWHNLIDLQEVWNKREEAEKWRAKLPPAEDMSK